MKKVLLVIIAILLVIFCSGCGDYAEVTNGEVANFELVKYPPPKEVGACMET